ncbi:hypothetical protein EWU23_13320 [Cytophagaceae bacterium 50C-KIRBA]|uniref:Uncharacterized protein n=1 Tax=Aquirufa beregesia TaxID=2516556 RepID=A0ABX0EXY1_9BACT|nr:hypothetical protein [Aquirufa beregesia]
MKTILKFTFFLFLISYSQESFGKEKFRLVEDYVFLCNGPNSKVYHRSENCKGLNRCSTQIAKVLVSVAQNKGRRACKIEY